MASVAAQSLDAQLSRIEQKLLAARKHDRWCERFGAASHGYRLGPTLPASRVVEFETKLAVALPDDFRRFLMELGNGGAGPAYGWPSFNPDAKVFRHPGWQAPFEIPKDGDDDDEPGGCIRLSDHGCGIFDFLVVNGAERGTVWFDDTCDVYPLPGSDFDSLRDLPADGTSSIVWRQRLRDPTNTSRISFGDYIEKWLDEVLADNKLSAP